MDGILVIDKPEGWTSHDVVAHVKKKLSARKVGHLGTLDPLATGVLPLVIDKATKSASLFDGGKKGYLVKMRIGAATDTCDRDGKAVFEKDPGGVRPDDVVSALSGFVGRIRQVPPMYSAIKMNGRPLYKLARKGIVVEREPREVEVYGLHVLDVSIPDVRFAVSCSRGTYVRSICDDAGRLIGCGAHLTELRRTESGGFGLDDAIGPEAPREALIERMIPLEEALKRAVPGQGGRAAESGAGALA